MFSPNMNNPRPNINTMEHTKMVNNNNNKSNKPHPHRTQLQPHPHRSHLIGDHCAWIHIVNLVFRVSDSDYVPSMVILNFHNTSTCIRIVAVPNCKPNSNEIQPEQTLVVGSEQCFGFTSQSNWFHNIPIWRRSWQRKHPLSSGNSLSNLTTTCHTQRGDRTELSSKNQLLSEVNTHFCGVKSYKTKDDDHTNLLHCKNARLWLVEPYQKIPNQTISGKLDITDNDSFGLESYINVAITN